MSNKQNGLECTLICWGIAAIVGVGAIVMLYMLAGFDGNQAAFIGALIGLVLGVVLTVFICRGQTAAADLASDNKPAQRYAQEAAARRGAAGAVSTGHAEASSHAETRPATEDSAGAHTETRASHTEDAQAHAETAADTPSHAEEKPAATAQAAAPAAAATVGKVSASRHLPGQSELAGRKSTWKYEAKGDAPGEVDKASAIPAGATEAPAVTPDAEAVAASREQSDATPQSSAHVEEARPETLYTAPPAEGADDLKRISGVGPKLEQTLNDLGIYRYAQIADWGPSDIAWVDNRLKFKGRIERDDWMSQARRLADGGEAKAPAGKKT